MKKRIGTAILAAAISVSLPVYSGGGGLTGGATEITQLLNNAELLDIAISEAQNLAYQIRQYEIMYENMRNLPNHIKQQALGNR